MKRINIGCGDDIKDGWINLDQHDRNGADVVFDLNELFNGGKLPFKDKEFDYIYCSHVLEDFIDPMTIIKELIRICKMDGEIEIRTPFETNTHLTNIFHKSVFTLSKLKSIVELNCDYNEDFNLEIKELTYYNSCDAGISLKGKLFYSFTNFYIFFLNFIGYKLVERTFIKYLFCNVDCKVVYRRINEIKHMPKSRNIK